MSLVRSAIYGVAAVWAVASQSALAETVRVEFSGTVQSFEGSEAGTATRLSTAEAEAALGGSIQIGTPFSGYIEYDDGAIPYPGQGSTEGGIGSASNMEIYSFGTPVNPITGAFDPYINPPKPAHEAIGEFVGDGSVSGIQVSDNELFLENAFPSFVQLSAGVYVQPPSGSRAALSGFYVLVEGAAPGSPLHSTSSVGIPWNLQSFPTASAHWLFEGSDGLSIYVDGTLDSLAPEPAEFGLVALALGTIAARRRAARERGTQP
jgi:hypothetical protein